MTPQPPSPRSTVPSPWRRLAWLPIPLSLALIAGLWVADLRTPYESRVLMVLLNVVFTWLASLCICILTGRGFLRGGQPGLLMFGCGSLVWGVTSLSAAVIVDRVNTTITVHNVGMLGAALCHFAGLLWRGRVTRPGKWLALGYAGALAGSVLIAWAAMAGLTPLFFVQGQGGTPVRHVVLLLAIALFGWVAWQMIRRYRRQGGAFYYWYGLGLGLVATGLTGVVLLTVQGGILGWTNRLTQFLGSAYLFVAAAAPARETGTWELSLAGLEDAWRDNWSATNLRREQPRLWLLLRYGLALGAVAAALWARLALTAWVGPGLPLFVTFFPAIMVASLLGGFGPGLAATILSGVVLDVCFLSPIGHVAIASPVDRLGLVIFLGLSVFVSFVAEIYRVHRHKAEAYDREAALRDSQARLATFAELSFEGIVESGNGRIVDCNEQCARMLGYSVAEMKGMDIARMVAPEDLERVKANLRLGRDSTIEHVAIRKDGTRIVIEAHGRPLSPGSLRRHTAIRDVTERKQAEQRYRLLFQSLQEGFYLAEAIFDEQGQCCDAVYLDANPAFEQLMGLTRDQIVGKRAKELVPRIKPEWLEVFGKVTRTGEPMTHQARSDVFGKFFEAFVFRPEPGRFAVLVTDVTARKQAEEELRTNEDRFRAAFEGSAVPMSLTSPEGKMIRVNAAFCAMTGYSEAELLALHFYDFTHPDDLGVNREVVQELLAGKRASLRMEKRYVRKDGQIIWGDMSSTVVGDADGRPLYMVTHVQDITERKRSEDTLKQSRTAALNLMQDAVEAGKQAEKANANLERSIADLRIANAELARFNRVAVDRELRMVQLKKEVNAWCEKSGLPRKYKVEREDRTARQ